MLGWTVVDVYEDNDVSASGTKPRPSYQRMLADLDAGRADAVVVWDLDRLTRRPIEIEAFIDVADRRGVALASIGGDVDLATDNGRMFARIKGAVARAEVERKSARQRAANEQRAGAGHPPTGRRAFGYSPDGMTVVEAEAAEVRKAVDTVLAGGSIRGIVADLAARGVTTTMGGPWRPTELRRLLANPRDQAQGLREEEAALRARLDGLAEAFAEGDIDRAALRKGSERLRGRLAEVTTTLASLAVSPAVADLVSSDDVRAAWEALDLDRRRAVVDTLLGVILHSPGRGARRFDPATVDLTWR